MRDGGIEGSFLGTELTSLVLLPIGLGLFGFIEPCSIGSSMVLVRFLEGRPAGARVRQIVIFTVTRAVFIGALGALAAIAGSAFMSVQKLGWLALGLLYLGLGALYLFGKAGALMRSIGPGLSRWSAETGSAALGVAFGLNVPACAAPLLLAVLGTAAVGAGGSVMTGFFSLSLFGIALSAPLVLVIAWPPARRALDRLAGRAARAPRRIGAILVVVGAWSVYFGLFVSIES